MMSLPIRPWPLRKLPVVPCCPCNYHRKAPLFFLSVSTNCTHLRLYSCVPVYEVSHPSRTRGLLPVPRLFLSHSFTWLPQDRQPRGFSLQPLLCVRRGQKTSRPGAKRERTAPWLLNVIFTHLFSFDPQLQRDVNHKAYLCFPHCGFCWNCCRAGIVTPLLTRVLLWITGADIVQWLMKNLSIEDPGKCQYM